jgi:putative transposase
MRGDRPGRPTTGWKLFYLIRPMQTENPTRGAPRITSELRLLGHEIGQSTVSRYMKRGRQPRRSQDWTPFIRNHMQVTATCDFFVVPSVAFQRLFVFVVLSRDRRLIRYIAVTARPTAAWTAQQIEEAFPEAPRPTYLVRDRDLLYGRAFQHQLEALAIADTKIAPRQHWMNAYAERVVGTLRRECTDHVIVFNERHLLAILRE